jgi:D-glycero-D-manno-heptose 1,7-bisphosphate phosphatase
MSKKYLLLDRDGTLIKHVPYLHRVEEVEILPEVVPVLIRALEMNFRFGIVTNQSAIGRGIASSRDVNRVNKFLCNEFFKLCGIRFDFVHYCPHIPEDKCLCRKPNIGMIKKELAIGKISIYESFMIGDQEIDVLFGKNIGVKTILISRQNDLDTQADYVVDDFLAITSILQLPT